MKTPCFASTQNHEMFLKVGKIVTLIILWLKYDKNFSKGRLSTWQITESKTLWLYMWTVWALEVRKETVY